MLFALLGNYNNIISESVAYPNSPPLPSLALSPCHLCSSAERFSSRALLDCLSFLAIAPRVLLRFLLLLLSRCCLSYDTWSGGSGGRGNYGDIIRLKSMTNAIKMLSQLEILVTNWQIQMTTTLPFTSYNCNTISNRRRRRRRRRSRDLCNLSCSYKWWFSQRYDKREIPLNNKRKEIEYKSYDLALSNLILSKNLLKLSLFISQDLNLSRHSIK